ncbi:MAG: hypothetical protein MHPSP_001391, partial [Paramarteilia canceri]
MNGKTNDLIIQSNFIQQKRGVSSKCTFNSKKMCYLPYYESKEFRNESNFGNELENMKPHEKLAFEFQEDVSENSSGFIASKRIKGPLIGSIDLRSGFFFKCKVEWSPLTNIQQKKECLESLERVKENDWVDSFTRIVVARS